MKNQKWSKWNHDFDIEEDRLQIIFDNIQHKVNENYFDNHYPTLFRNGWAEFAGYQFYPKMEKFLVKVLRNDMTQEFHKRYAKDLESAIKNAQIEFQISDNEIIPYPFKY